MIINQSFNISIINKVDLRYLYVNLENFLLLLSKWNSIEDFKSVISFFETVFLVVRLTNFLSSLSKAVLKNFINVFSWACSISFTWAGMKFDFELILLNLAFVNNNYIIFWNGFLIFSFLISKNNCFTVTFPIIL